MRSLACVCVCLVACSFSGGGGSDIINSGPDAAAVDAAAIDAPATDADPGCPWGDRAFFDPCGNDKDALDAAFPTPPADVTISADAVFDTEDAVFDVGDAPGLLHAVVTIGGAEVYVWLVNDLTVEADVTVIGENRPLIIAALGTISISVDASIDVGSRWVVDNAMTVGGALVDGAGASVATCPNLDGTNSSDGGGGGGGGGFGSDGGAGAMGRNNTVNAGAGGPTVLLADITSLRGGCPGGQGGTGNNAGRASAAFGGGGLLLSAVGAVTIEGDLGAGGATGLGQFDGSRNGGGGGGSGGLIVVQGATIGVPGGLFANGGGGGGGADNRDLTNANNTERATLYGQNGLFSILAASGAAGENSDATEAGGDGAVEGTAGAPGSGDDRSGAGGGGGVGRVVLVTQAIEHLVTPPATASPAAVHVDVDLSPY